MPNDLLFYLICFLITLVLGTMEALSMPAYTKFANRQSI